ncbi:MAG: Stp1/IreP family PP2C-type Ser/Thr phosphatase [Acutalibacteraceae bacterium]|nr:Stp1/IreP family PP2C-type Ser/Thr phosphatase [Oscillospiraceae bacterium]
MHLVSKSDIGLKRSNNEDCVLTHELGENAAFAVLCDGMGGANAGQVASKMACEMIAQKIEMCYRDGMTISSIENMLLSAITTANVSIYDAAGGDSSLKGMGTTVICAVVIAGQICVGHAGDSRAYIVSRSGIRQLTRDHSFVQQMYDKGEISIDQLKNHPNKNLITRALGVEEEIEIDFNTDYLGEDETLLLCSDGLSNYVDADEIYQIINSTEADKVADALVDRANANGGGDNISVAAVSY